MSTVDDVRKLAASGMTQSAIADALGVSRQRVNQIVRASGIKVKRYKNRWADPNYVRKPAGPPRPRLMTGGVAVKISHAAAGTVSELLVAADLIARGWKVFMPVFASQGHDVVASKDGRLVTFEVRSAHRNASGAIKYARKAECASEVYALVITGEPVQYEPPIE